MNLEKLKQAERQFFLQHPEGFSDPSMQEIAKRHRMDKMVEFAQQSFSEVYPMIRTVSWSV